MSSPEQAQTVREARWDWIKAGANYYGFRIGVTIAAIAVISGMNDRMGWGLTKLVEDATGIPYKDIDLSLTLLDASILVFLGWLYWGSPAKELREKKNEERDDYRESRDAHKSQK